MKGTGVNDERRLDENTALMREHGIHILGERTIVAALITDPETVALVCANLFARMDRLTPSESKLAALVLEGATVRSAAERLGITQHTVRSHLKSLFQKTQIHRQSELVNVSTREFVVRAA